MFADLADDEDTVMVSDDFVVFLHSMNLRLDPVGRLDRRSSPIRWMAYSRKGVYYRSGLANTSQVSKSIWGI